MKKNFKCLFILLSGVSFIGGFIIIVIVLSIFGVIKEYKYLKINDSNRNEITNLLYDQKSNMFNITNDFNFDQCIKSMKKIEIEFKFPDGEDYVIYCNDTKFEFSLDNTNYDLPKYMRENGKLGYRFRK